MNSTLTLRAAAAVRRTRQVRQHGVEPVDDGAAQQALRQPVVGRLVRQLLAQPRLVGDVGDGEDRAGALAVVRVQTTDADADAGGEKPSDPVISHLHVGVGPLVADGTQALAQRLGVGHQRVQVEHRRQLAAHHRGQALVAVDGGAGDVELQDPDRAAPR